MGTKTFLIFRGKLEWLPWQGSACSKDVTLTISCDRVTSASITLKLSNCGWGDDFGVVYLDGVQTMSIGPVPPGQSDVVTLQVSPEQVCGTHVYRVCAWARPGTIYGCAEVEAYVSVTYEEGGGASQVPETPWWLWFAVVIMGVMSISTFALALAKRKD